MIEKYFTEKDVEVKDIKDTGTSLAITCTCPDWAEDKTITLSDLGTAKALGMEPKDYSREEFIEAVKKSFSVKFDTYFIPEWEFPIPVEWKEAAKEHIEGSKKDGMFFAIDSGYIKGEEPPLFAFQLLKEVEDTYRGLPAKDAFIPSSISNLIANPGSLFEEITIKVED